jgi:hypothetical protein
VEGGEKVTPCSSCKGDVAVNFRGYAGHGESKSSAGRMGRIADYLPRPSFIGGGGGGMQRLCRFWLGIQFLSPLRACVECWSGGTRRAPRMPPPS